MAIERLAPDDAAGRAAMVRRETVRLVGIAKSGHYSSVFSCAEMLGVLYSAALVAADRLAAEDGIETTVLDAHTVRPFDAETFCAAAERTGLVLVAEEHNVYGGVATACADALVDAGVGARLSRLGMPADEYSLIGPPTHLYRHYRLDADGVTARARELLAGPAEQRGEER
jgi:transketolase C-terminal domain/subunit